MRLLWFLSASVLFAQQPNILGRVDVQKGEARRNENIFITALDNNTQKESNVRLGTTATAITEFNAATRYYGAEFGLSPSAASASHAGPRGQGRPRQRPVDPRQLRRRRAQLLPGRRRPAGPPEHLRRPALGAFVEGRQPDPGRRPG
jgi:hypothetical protein